MEAVVALVVCGVSGAGKSTVGGLLAQQLGWDFFDADDFHPPANVAKMRGDEPLTDEDRGPWLDALHALIERHAAEGRRLVLACSALKEAYRARLGIDQQRVISVFLDGSKSLLAARLAKRTHTFMPASLLDSQLEALEVPRDGIRIAIDTTPETAVQRILAAIEGPSTRPE
ncbi:MAG: gluconokinase [Pseudomonadales bacterium]